MSIDKQYLREVAKQATGAHERINAISADDIFDISLHHDVPQRGGRQMSNRIPNFGWNRLKLAKLTYAQLAQLEEQVKAEHACKNGIHLFDKAGQRKLDTPSWAVYNKQKAERAA